MVSYIVSFSLALNYWAFYNCVDDQADQYYLISINLSQKSDGFAPDDL